MKLNKKGIYISWVIGSSSNFISDYGNGNFIY